jgi:HEAT repeat protein
MRPARLFLALALMAVPSAVGNAALPPSDGNPRTAYFSVGDNQDLLWLPLDSQLSVETAFDALRDRYRIERVWWRGGQVEWWGREFDFRPENRRFDQIWRWWKYLDYEDVGVNRLAVQAAHERGMQIWSALNLFDGGAQPDAGYSGFPYAAENRLRVEHPEYVPVNRWGTWRQGGPVEFAYPEARRAIVDQLVRHAVEGGYDGLALMTYVENYSQRYDDEFGFNEPIVTEFQRRHGIDIRRQPFDKQAWSNLRGEYLTQFLRELRGPMTKHGKKLAICVDGHDPHLPVLWSAHGGVRTAGLISMDVATWAKERLVDEVCVWAPRDERAEALLRCVELCRGTATVASSLRTRGTLPAGVPRVMFLGHDVESGFDWEHYIHQRDERVELGPNDTLDSPDRYARRRVLTAILKKKAAASFDQLKAASSDRDLYVRRMALRALAETKNASAVPVAENALHDAEHSVRLQAAATLGEIAGAQSLPKLLEVIAHEPQSYQLRFRVLTDVLRSLQAQGRLSPAQKAPLVARLRDSSATLRETALYALQLTGAPASADVEAALKNIVGGDESPFARELAIVNLRSTFGPKPTVLAVFRAATHDRDDAVAVHALAAVAMMAKQPSASTELRSQGLTEALDFFHRYGDGCTRSDKDWGWRLAGEAVLGFGEPGVQAMSGLIEDPRDRRLAELAWRVVYLRQGDSFYRITLEEDRAAHAHHPFLKHEP